MAVNERPIRIFLWRLPSAPLSADDMTLACARSYAKAADVAGGAGFFADPPPGIARDEKGKPFFPSMPTIHFSLSHSGDFCACAFHTGPVGLDLQIHAECRREAIARRWFHPEEYAFLEKNNFEDFFQVWAAKESYVKYTGTGITGGLNRFSVADNTGMKDKMNGQGNGAAGRVEFYRREYPDNYSLCLCAGSVPEVRIEVIAEKT